MKSVCMYFHVHQPFRVKHYTAFDSGNDHNYFYVNDNESKTNNENVLRKVAQKSYRPTNKKLLELLHRHPEVRFSMSISGTIIEQLEKWDKETLESFKELVKTNRVEIVGETYHHSLAFFYSREEFETQVRMHEEVISRVFNKKPQIFRNTELAYNNDLAYWADKAGYKGILAEGWDPILGWRSPNYMYRPAYTDNIRLLLKNYKLSDDIAFRFSDRNWAEWPLTASKFAHWLNAGEENEQIINLFMDYETFGEHQWEDSGIFEFLNHLPNEFLRREGNSFLTLSEAIEKFEPVDKVDVPNTLTWADTERDLSAWLGNAMQQEAIKAIYSLQDKIYKSEDLALIEDWRKLQTSDHFYYMCTKWFNDGDIHAYFSPYESPYEAFMNFMHVVNDLKFRLAEKGVPL